VAATTTSPPPRISVPRTGARTYDAFVSYSHAADGRLAPALQRGLQSLAKPWYRRRALRVFRDKTSLSASPELWSAIEEALSQARFFILLASPEAAASHWVDQEVRWWRENRGHETVLIVLTEGELGWDEARGDFDETSAIPPGLRGWFPREPLWVDLRWARDERDVSMRNPRFRDSIGELAAPIHGVPKDELIGEDISQHRRTMRLARGAVALLAVLLALAVVGGIVALVQRNRAENQAHISRSRELAATARLKLEDDPDAGLRLAVQAAEEAPTSEAEQALRLGLEEPHAMAALRGGGAALGAAFGRDGREVVTAGADGKARFWKTTRAAPTVITPNDGEVNAAVLSPDGRRMATATGRGSVDLWAIPEGEKLLSLWDGEGEVYSASFSDDGKLVAASGHDGRVRVWRVSNGALVTRFSEAHPVFSVQFETNGYRVVSAGQDGTARVWDATTGRAGPVLRSPAAAGEMNWAAFSPDGRQIVTASQDGGGRIWSLKSGSLASVMRPSEDEMYMASFSANGRLIVTAGLDGTARIWNPTALSPVTAEKRPLEIRTMRTPGGDVFAASFSPDGRRIITASSDGFARLWRVQADEAERVYRAHTDLYDVAYAPSSDRVLVGAQAGRAREWNPGSGTDIQLFGPVPRSSFESVAYSPGGDQVATAGDGLLTRLWNARTGREVAELHTYDYQTDIAFSSNGKHVITSDEAGRATIWDPQAARVVERVCCHDDAVLGAALSPDGATAATASVDQTVRLWDLGTKEFTELRAHRDKVWSVAFDPDGRRLVTSSEDGTALVWDAASGAKVAALRGHAGPVYDAVFSPGGDRIATAGADATVRVWESETGKPLDILEGHENVVTGVAFSPDGRRIATSSNDFTSRTFRCGLCRPLPDLLELAETQLLR
jgi:WD40 repeat protein